MMGTELTAQYGPSLGAENKTMGVRHKVGNETNLYESYSQLGDSDTKEALWHLKNVSIRRHCE